MPQAKNQEVKSTNRYDCSSKLDRFGRHCQKLHRFNKKCTLNVSTYLEVLTLKI